MVTAVALALLVTCPWPRRRRAGDGCGFERVLERRARRRSRNRHVAVPSDHGYDHARPGLSGRCRDRAQDRGIRRDLRDVAYARLLMRVRALQADPLVVGGFEPPD
jgi:hypothetical protein